MHNLTLGRRHRHCHHCCHCCLCRLFRPCDQEGGASPAMLWLSKLGRGHTPMQWGCCWCLWSGYCPACQATVAATVAKPLHEAPGCTWQVQAGLTLSTTLPNCTGLQGWWHCPRTLATRTVTTTMVASQSRAKQSQGIVGPVICAAVVPIVEMACEVDPGTSDLEWSNLLANWAMDIGSAMGRGGDNKAGEEEDVFGADFCWWGWRQRLCKPLGWRTMVIPRAPAPTLACIAGVTEEGRNSETVIVLVAAVVGRGIKSNMN